MNRKETQGLLALVVVAVLGVSTQSYMRHRDRGDQWIEQTESSGSESPSSAASSGGAAASKALRADGRLDLNLAEASDLERLSGIGPKRAEAILALRRQKGKFRSSKELMEVSGIAEKTWQSLDPLVFIEAPTEGVASEPSTEQPLSLASPPVDAGGGASGEARIDINRATSEQLQTLWNIGASKAEAIIQWRQTHGPFKTPKGLERVPGIGPETIRRNLDRIVVYQ